MAVAAFWKTPSVVLEPWIASLTLGKKVLKDKIVKTAIMANIIKYSNEACPLFKSILTPKK